MKRVYILVLLGLGACSTQPKSAVDFDKIGKEITVTCEKVGGGKCGK